MLLGNDRNEYRKVFFEAWRKHRQQEPLTEQESELVHIIIEHPEYHQVFEQPEKYLDKDYLPEMGETNPFMHIGLHQTIRDQLKMQLPKELPGLFQQLRLQLGTTMAAEHACMESLIAGIWESQNFQKPFDDIAYIERIKKMLNH